MKLWRDTEQQMFASTCKLRPLLFIFLVSDWRGSLAVLYSHISTLALLMVFGFLAGAVNGATLICFVFCFGLEGVSVSSIILTTDNWGTYPLCVAYCFKDALALETAEFLSLFLVSYTAGL